MSLTHKTHFYYGKNEGSILYSFEIMIFDWLGG